ncbi:hypothetical protein PSU4_22410 [Pseudonocardia sulfidoxydans NBRC 16205]|uniref:DUF4097 domain-containing protein n=1 Tax=Pseudonocardia sulfidoxydans NBRC 16205 TaxID=1223511 RepID=A0A511DFI8_9PSEU|nr:DUF4097 family beta strand repeat-containing protein [Pseudonocardia sulfidoxydans]GEL23287.1 hypothetical protein PSU4_22410 [Pseudonocardia sulfidoxydans NBRC 16205]
MSAPTTPTAPTAAAEPDAARAPRRPHPALVVVAAVVVLVAAVIGVAQLLGDAVHSTTTTDATYALTTPRLAVTTDSGDITVVVSDDDAVHVRTQATHGLATPDLVAEPGPAGLVLDSHCNGFLGDFCQVSYTVAVPRAVSVMITGGIGDVVVGDLDGRVDVDNTGGDVLLTGLGGDVTVRTLSGDVVATGLRSGSVLAETSTGDVSVTGAVAPTSVTARSTIGDIDVAVPATRPYRVDVGPGSDLGSARVLLPADPTATATVSATSDHGDVTVRPV